MNTFETISDFEWEAHYPQVGLRFVLRDGKRILQQQFSVSRYTIGNVPVASRIEWKDVPLVDEADES